MLHTIFLILAMCDSSGTQCDFEAHQTFEGVNYEETVKECEKAILDYPRSQDVGCYRELENTSLALVYESVSDDRVLIFEK